MKEVDNFMKVGGSLVNQLLEKSPDQIATEVSYMTPDEHLAFVTETFKKLRINLSGTGMEVAAGVAIFSCSLAKLYPKIEKIYALEIVEEKVNKLQPKIIEGSHLTNRVIPIVGDFDQIQFPDASLDFVVGFDSLHHSNNLSKTLTEIRRVLKSGGQFICFDRAHPDRMTIKQENFLLNTEYSTNYKVQHGLDVSQPYKRSDNGEHEPRIDDWKNAFNDAGLKLKTIAIFSKRNMKDLIKIIVAKIPYPVRAYLKTGRNLTAHTKLLFYYLCPNLAHYGKLKIFSLHTEFKTPTAPIRKMIIVGYKE